MTLIPDLQRDLVDAAARWNGERRRFGAWWRLTPRCGGRCAHRRCGAAVRRWRIRFGAVLARTRLLRSRRPAPPRSGSQAAVAAWSAAEAGQSQPGGQVRVRRGGLFERRLPRPQCVARRRDLQPGAGTTGRSRAEGGRRHLRGRAAAAPGARRPPARTVGGGGGQPTQLSGFARADVASIAVRDPQYPSRAVLSEPWRPAPWQGQPIRFFLVLIDAPRDRARDLLFGVWSRLKARLTRRRAGGRGSVAALGRSPRPCRFLTWPGCLCSSPTHPAWRTRSSRWHSGSRLDGHSWARQIGAPAADSLSDDRPPVDPPRPRPGLALGLRIGRGRGRPAGAQLAYHLEHCRLLYSEPGGRCSALTRAPSASSTPSCWTPRVSSRRRPSTCPCSGSARPRSARSALPPARPPGRRAAVDRAYSICGSAGGGRARGRERAVAPLPRGRWLEAHYGLGYTLLFWTGRTTPTASALLQRAHAGQSLGVVFRGQAAEAMGRRRGSRLLPEGGRARA